MRRSHPKSKPFAWLKVPTLGKGTNLGLLAQGTNLGLPRGRGLLGPTGCETIFMTISMLYSKIHRATVTGADLNYEGSIAIDRALIAAANLLPLQEVDIYNINNGERFSTYVIPGETGEIALNGAAARRVQQGDLLIICAYCHVEKEKTEAHTAQIVLLGADNIIEKTFLGDTKY